MTLSGSVSCVPCSCFFATQSEGVAPSAPDQGPLALDSEVGLVAKTFGPLPGFAKGQRPFAERPSAARFSKRPYEPRHWRTDAALSCAALGDERRGDDSERISRPALAGSASGAWAWRRFWARSLFSGLSPTPGLSSARRSRPTRLRIGRSGVSRSPYRGGRSGQARTCEDRSPATSGDI